MKKIILLLLLAISLLFVGCSTLSIEDVKSKELIGEEVKVSGMSLGSIKLGELSGYTLQDETGEIFIYSENLVEKDEKASAKGILKKSILGYYIDEKEN